MKEGIHPNYKPTVIRCACGAVFYTGRQKLVDTSGRVDKFNKKYGIK